MARLVVVAALALLLGLFIGGIGPRRELARAKEELAEVKARAARGNAAALPLALGIGGLMAARQQAQDQAARPRELPRFVLVPDAGPAADDREGQPDGGPRRRRGFLADGQAFATAKAAADLRAAQFRAAFVEAARLSPAEEAALDEGVKTMNAELGQVTTELAETLASRGRKLAPRDIADVGARVLDVYRRADDRFKEGLGENGRQALDTTEFDLLTQIDVGVFQKLAETVEQLGTTSQAGRR